MRYIFLKTIAKHCGDNVCIREDVYLLNPDRLSVGDNVSFNPMCYVECAGGVIIGSNVGIAHSASILSTTHVFSDTTSPQGDQGIEYKQVVIEDDVWIGCKATILYGRTIGKGSVIAANAVITKNVKDYAVVAGVPAKEVKGRK